MTGTTSRVLKQIKINNIARAIYLHKQSFVSPTVCCQFVRILARLKML